MSKTSPVSREQPQIKMIPNLKYQGEQNQTLDIELFKTSYIGWGRIRCKELSSIMHTVGL